MRSRRVPDAENGPLWLPDEDGWDRLEWGYDDPQDPPSLYTLIESASDPVRC
jgi:hypothetical protein